MFSFIAEETLNFGSCFSQPEESEEDATNSKIPTDTFTGIEFGLFQTENQHTEPKTEDLTKFTESAARVYTSLGLENPASY